MRADGDKFQSDAQFHSRFSWRLIGPRKSPRFSYGEGTGSMVTLASNFNVAGSRFLTGLTAVFLARLRYTLARKVCTLSLIGCHHHGFSLLKSSLPQVSSYPARLSLPPSCH